MGTSERREREKQELKQKILDAARELFTERGYEAVTMREIAKRIEYSATALYSHFEDKDTLMLELCRADFATFAQKFLEVTLKVTDPIERMCWAGLTYTDFAKEYPRHYQLMFLTPLPPTPPREGERDDPAQNAYVFLRMLVADLHKADLLRPELKDVDLVSQTIWATVHGVAALDLIINKSMDWLDFKEREERVNGTLELITRGLMRDPEAGLAALKRVQKAAALAAKPTAKRPRQGEA